MRKFWKRPESPIALAYKTSPLDDPDLRWVTEDGAWCPYCVEWNDSDEGWFDFDHPLACEFDCAHCGRRVLHDGDDE